jgi:hypothetical protein
MDFPAFYQPHRGGQQQQQQQQTLALANSNLQLENAALRQHVQELEECADHLTSQLLESNANLIETTQLKLQLELEQQQQQQQQQNARKRRGRRGRRRQEQPVPAAAHAAPEEEDDTEEEETDDEEGDTKPSGSYKPIYGLREDPLMTPKGFIDGRSNAVASWNQKCDMLRDFVKEKGHAVVPGPYSKKSEAKWVQLAWWMEKQRRLYQNMIRGKKCQGTYVYTTHNISQVVVWLLYCTRY